MVGIPRPYSMIEAPTVLKCVLQGQDQIDFPFVSWNGLERPQVEFRRSSGELVSGKVGASGTLG